MSVAVVAFVVLAVLGGAVRTLTAHRLRSDLNAQATSDAQTFAGEIHITYADGHLVVPVPALNVDASLAGAVARVCTLDGSCQYGSANVPYLGSPLNPVREINGYSVVTERLSVGGVAGGYVLVQYGLPLASLDADIRELDLLLLLGVLAGTVLAFGGGWLVARRAITPIAELTAAAGEIERTGDPTLTLPDPTADDEVAELSRTLATMLASLSDARARTEASLERQRAFVADASHELRTPLTSVLANLELLADSLTGAERDAAQSALRSTRRMRRLVADLLLLARSDAGLAAPVPATPLDLADVVIAAASELEPASEDHMLELDVRPTPLLGRADDLERVAINLIENAIRHTPPGTRITASARPLADGAVELVVADDGPGIPPDVRARLFERFARGAGETSGSFGLGLAIVQAVTESHGGTIDVQSAPGEGARFTIVLPAGTAAPAELPPASRDVTAPVG